MVSLSELKEMKDKEGAAAFQEALIKNFHEMFLKASRESRIDELEWLTEQFIKVQRLTADEAEAFALNRIRGVTVNLAFCAAIENGNLAAIKFLKNQFHAQQLKNNIKQGVYNLYLNQAMKNGHLNVFKWLKVFAGEEVLQRKMSDFGYEKAIYDAIMAGHLKMIEWLKKHGSEFKISEGLFHEIIRKGSLEKIKWLGSQFDNPQQLRKAIGYRAFNAAIENSHLDALKWLKDQVGEDSFQEIVRGEGSYGVFRQALADHRPEAAKWFLENVSVFAFAESFRSGGDRDWMERDCQKLFIDLANKKLAALHQQREAALLANNHFDIKDEEEAKFAFIILKNLIRRNQPESMPDIRMLLSLPAVQSLFFKNQVGGNIKDLRELATANQNQEVLALLPVPAKEAVRLMQEGKSEIRFSGVGFNAEEIDDILSAIKENTALKIVDLSCNGLSEHMITKIFQALSEKTTLQSLDLRQDANFHMDWEARGAFLKLIVNNKQLTNVQLGRYGDKKYNLYDFEICGYLERNQIHAKLDRLSEELKVSLNFQKDISPASQKQTPYFDLQWLYSQMIRLKVEIQRLDSQKDVTKEHIDALNDHWLSQVALFHRRAMDTHYRDASIDKIEPRIIAAEKCLASMTDKNSLYYKEACHEIGSYYAECANNAATQEDKIAFIKTALNFWKNCLYDPEFMSSSAGNGFEVRFLMQIKELLPDFKALVSVDGGKLISDDILNDIYQKQVPKEKSPSDISTVDFKVEESLHGTAKTAANDSFILLLNKLSSDIGKHPDYSLVSAAGFFAKSNVSKEIITYSQVVTMLQDLVRDKEIDQNALMEKVTMLSAAKNLKVPLMRFIDSGQAELMLGKKVESISDFVGALCERQSANQSSTPKREA